MSVNILVDVQDLRRRDMTAGQMKVSNLKKELTKYELSKDVRRALGNEFVSFNKINYMDMELMAAALAYLETISGEAFNPLVMFTDSRITPFMLPMLDEATYQEVVNGNYTSLAYIKRKVDLLRYVNAILDYRAT